jgi:hypothetical protein
MAVMTWHRAGQGRETGGAGAGSGAAVGEQGKGQGLERTGAYDEHCWSCQNFAARPEPALALPWAARQSL